jgi:nucleotide-binding universal stress UspA family protein
MFTKILVPIDIDHIKTAAAVYRKAAALARCCGAVIRLITVLPGFGMPIVASFISDQIRKEVYERCKADLEAFIQETCEDAVTYDIRVGKNWEEIIKEADEWGADLIVVYHNRHREINEVFSRSCTQQVVDHAHCSVLRLRNVHVP